MDLPRQITIFMRGNCLHQLPHLHFDLVSNADPIMGRWSFPYIHSQAEETVNEMIDGIIVFSAGLAWQPGWLGVWNLQSV